ncbi:MAG: CBS domain-containing protein [Marmoricola sp.]
MKINDVIAAKPRHDVVTVPPDTTVRDLLAVLADNNVGAVVVSNDGRKIAGIVSERDVVRKLNGNDGVLDAPVSQIMTTDVVSVTPSDSLEGIRRMMTERRFRHLPVVDDGDLVGIVSIGDVVKTHIAEVEFERDQLDSYVHQT